MNHFAQRNKQHQMKLLLRNFHLIGNTPAQFIENLNKRMNEFNLGPKDQNDFFKDPVFRTH